MFGHATMQNIQKQESKYEIEIILSVISVWQVPLPNDRTTIVGYLLSTVNSSNLLTVISSFVWIICDFNTPRFSL